MERNPDKSYDFMTRAKKVQFSHQKGVEFVMYTIHYCAIIGHVLRVMEVSCCLRCNNLYYI